jgi:hypothetical protein
MTITELLIGFFNFYVKLYDTNTQVIDISSDEGITSLKNSLKKILYFDSKAYPIDFVKSF